MGTKTTTTKRRNRVKPQRHELFPTHDEHVRNFPEEKLLGIGAANDRSRRDKRQGQNASPATVARGQSWPERQQNDRYCRRSVLPRRAPGSPTRQPRWGGSSCLRNRSPGALNPEVVGRAPVRTSSVRLPLSCATIFGGLSRPSSGLRSGRWRSPASGSSRGVPNRFSAFSSSGAASPMPPFSVPLCRIWPWKPRPCTCKPHAREMSLLSKSRSNDDVYTGSPQRSRRGRARQSRPAPPASPAGGCELRHRRLLRDLAFAQASQQKMFGYKRAAAAMLALDSR